MNHSSEYLKIVLRGGVVERFHQHVAIRRENVAEHSYYVAMFADHIAHHDLSLDASARLNILRAALHHDLAEQEMGDLPAPIKTFPAVNLLFHEMEREFEKKHGLVSTRNLPDIDRVVVKLGDVLAGMLYCLRERSVGNVTLRKVFHTYQSYFGELLKELPGMPMTTAIEINQQIVEQWSMVNEC